MSAIIQVHSFTGDVEVTGSLTKGGAEVGVSGDIPTTSDILNSTNLGATVTSGATTAVTVTNKSSGSGFDLNFTLAPSAAVAPGDAFFADITQEQILTASNAGNLDYFGVSVAMSTDGNTVIVGAYQEDGQASDGGAAYIYRYDTQTLVWSEQTILRASNGSTDNEFGRSVAISADGNVVIVGASSEDGPSDNTDNSGAAYVFRYSSGTWSQDSIILRASNTEAQDLFGWSVAMSADGNTVIVGAYHEDGATNNTTHSGAAYVFRYSSGTWSQDSTILRASDTTAGYYFGCAVAMSKDGNTVIVGSYYGSMRGAAYVFRYSSGTWSQDSQILRADVFPFQFGSNADVSDDFGWSVAMSEDGNTVIIGAPKEDGPTNNVSGSGAAYVFRYNTTWDTGTVLRTSNAGTFDYFGYAVAMSRDGNKVIVGAPFEDGHNGDTNGSGAAYVFMYDTSTSLWSESIILRASDGSTSDNFGSQNHVAISGDGNTFIVGAARVDTINDNDVGAAYIFQTYGNNIYYTSGRVGIGYPIPASITNTSAHDHIAYAIDVGSYGRWVVFDASTYAFVEVVDAVRNINNAGTTWGYPLISNNSLTGTNFIAGDHITLNILTGQSQAGYQSYEWITTEPGSVGRFAKDLDVDATMGIAGNLFPSTAFQVLRSHLQHLLPDPIISETEAVALGADRFLLVESNGSYLNRFRAYQTDGTELFSTAANFTVDKSIYYSAYNDFNLGDSFWVETVTSSEQYVADKYFYKGRRSYGSGTTTSASGVFGYSVTMSRDGYTMIVGRWRSQFDPGAIHVFRRYRSNQSGFRGGKWQEMTNFTTSNANDGDQFGYSMPAISDDGTVFIVGAEGEDGGRGAAYVFRNYGTYLESWSEDSTILTASNAAANPGGDEKFGTSVAMSADGNTVIVGSPNENGDSNYVSPILDYGAAYIYRYSSGTWSEDSTILRASNIGNNDHFGTSVAMSADGNTVIVGAPNEDGATNTTTNSGAAYVFRYSSGTWSQDSQILRASNVGSDDEFGSSVAISADGNIVIVGAPNEDGATNTTAASGATYVFRYSSGTWSQDSQILRASNLGSGDKFGYTIAISTDGNKVIVGVPEEDGIGTNTGAAYVFRYDGTLWYEENILRGLDTSTNTQFGNSIAMSGDGNSVTIGAYRDGYTDTTGAGYTDNDGGVYFFSVNKAETVDLSYVSPNLNVSTPIKANGTILSFTGQHMCSPHGDMSQGLVVSANKNMYTTLNGPLYSGSRAINSSESLPVVSLSSIENDPSVFGVVDHIEESGTERIQDLGGILVKNTKKLGDDRVIVNSIGEGALWVVDTGGPLISGDLVTTSNVHGYAQRQDGTIRRSYTIGKITMDCDFNPSDIPVQVATTDEGGQLQWEDTNQMEKAYKIRYLDANGVETDEAKHVYKAAYVGCTYHCG